MCVTNKSSSGFHKQCSREINGQHTEFVFHRFANKWFLLITQYGKVPNLYTVQFDVRQNEEIPESLHVNHPEFHASVPVTMTCNFGGDKDEIRSGIQFLINRTNLNKCPTEFIVGLGLKEINGSCLREVAKVLDELL